MLTIYIYVKSLTMLNSYYVSDKRYNENLYNTSFCTEDKAIYFLSDWKMSLSLQFMFLAG